MPMNYDDGEVSFEIVEEIGVLASYSTGWTKEINLVSWNNGPARYDIREWDPRHRRMSKGLTFEEREMRILIDSLKKRRYGGARASKPEQGPPDDSSFVETEKTDEANETVEEETL